MKSFIKTQVQNITIDSAPRGFLSDQRSEQEKMNDVIEGTDIAILFALCGWFFIGIMFQFSTNETIIYILDFYDYFNYGALAYIALHFFYVHKQHSDPEYKWLNFKSLKSNDILRGLLFTGLCFGILLLLSTMFTITFWSGKFDFINTYNMTTDVILQISRTIPTEELVWRGLGMMLLIPLFSRVIGLKDNISNLIAIIITGLSFGLMHYFRYGFNYPALLSLCTLGFLCGYLALYHGLWAAMLLHVINNLVAAFSGSFFEFNAVFNSYMIVGIILLIITILVVYWLVKLNKEDRFNFIYFTLSSIIFFIIAFMTNGIIKSEDFNGLYFEHFHLIFFIPLIYLICKYSFSNSQDFYSILIGICVGFFISDYYDIINQDPIQWTWTVLYGFQSMIFYFFINMYYTTINKKKMTIKRGI